MGDFDPAAAGPFWGGRRGSEQRLPFSISLVEAKPALAGELRNSIQSLPHTTNLFDAPLIEVGEFSDHVDRILARLIYSAYPKTATFAFVDPCRASGYGVLEVRSILDKRYGECLLFWNYEGVNRWLGSVAAQHSEGAGLTQLFGSESGLQHALQIWSSARNTPEKERDLLSHFLRCVSEYSGAEFLVPFRFTSESAKRTSHYLIHCSKNPLAFKIMKEIMGSLRTNTEPGHFSFLGPSDVGDQVPMFIPEAEAAASTAISNELSKGRRPVRFFSEDWVRRPGDLFRATDYKRILLTMEAEGQVEVLCEDGSSITPASKRPNRQGRPTLADRLVVRLGNKTPGNTKN